MSLELTLQTLDSEMSQSFFQFNKRRLDNLITGLVKSKDKETLVKLISDNSYFTLLDIIDFLEKKDKQLLYHILNEPKNPAVLRQPIADWLKRSEFLHEDNVRIPKSRQRIDMVGCKYKKYLGLVGENAIIAIEIATEPKISAINAAFYQAKDYLDCSDWAYVAVSPYVFLKYSEALLGRVNDFKNDIGLLLVNRLKVISIVEEAEVTNYIDHKYQTLLSFFKKKYA
jgi:hypothetical protein